MRTKLRSKLSLHFVVFGVLLAFPAVALADQLANNVDDNIDANVEELSLESGKTRTVQVYVNAQGGCDITGTESIRVSVTSSNTSRATARWTDGQADITDSGKQILFKGCGTENGKNVTVKAETEIGASDITFKVEQNNAGPGSTFITNTATFKVNTVSDRLANDADNTIDATVEEFSLESHGKTRTVKVFVDPILEVCNFDPNSNGYINVRINQSHSNASGTTARWDAGQGATNNDLDVRFTGCGTENGKRVLVTSGNQTGSVTISFTIDQNNAGGTFETNSATFKANITQDMTAPTVTSVVPAEDATNVAVGTNVQATFSEAMNSGTVSGSTFTLTAGNNQVGATVNYANNKATLTPNADLQANTQYTATIVGGANGAKDLAGNALIQNKTWSFTTAAPPTPADATPPDITPNVQGTLGDNGWYTSNVTVSWTVSDPDSTISSSNGCSSTTISTDTAGQTLTCTATSAGGSDSKSVTIKRDATAPTGVSGTPDRAPDSSSGWYNHAVSITFSGNDALSGIPTGGCDTKNYSGPDDATASVTGSCTDRAGNVGQGSFGPLKYDATAPNVVASPDRPADHNGWYNHAVTVDFADSTDATSGIDSCDPAVTYSGPDGTGRSVSGSCTDNAGNSAQGTFGPFKYDATAPVNVSGAPNRPVDHNGWYNSPVSIVFQGSDVTSGIDSCSTVPYNGPDGTGLTVNGSCTDKAANESTQVASSVFKYDATKPINITFSGINNGDTFDFGDVPALASLSCSAQDATSGPPSCTASGYSNAVGTHTLTATATDQAGNSDTKTLSYVVLAWKLSGFYQPVDMNDVVNTVKNGSTVPLKFEVFKASGSELTDTGIVKQPLTAKQVSCTGFNGDPVDQIELLATGGSTLRYDSTGGQFIYNWQTPKGASQVGKCFTVSVGTQDGSSIPVASFKLK